MRNQKGMTLVMAMALALVLGILGYALVQIAQYETKFMVKGKVSDASLYVAEGGAHWAMHILRSSSTYTGEGNHSLGEGTFDVEVESLGSDQYLITSTGSIPSGGSQEQRVVRAKVKRGMEVFENGIVGSLNVWMYQTKTFGNGHRAPRSYLGGSPHALMSQGNIELMDWNQDGKKIYVDGDVIAEGEIITGQEEPEITGTQTEDAETTVAFPALDFGRLKTLAQNEGHYYSTDDAFYEMMDTVDTSGGAWHSGTNIFSCDSAQDKLYRHNAALGVANTYDSPGSFPNGLTYDEKNIWSCDSDADKICRHVMGGELKIAEAYDSPGSRPSGLAWDGEHIWSCDSYTDKIYKHNMDSSLSVATAYNSPFTNPSGLAWDGEHIWSCDSDSHTIYIHNMDATLSVATYYFSPGNSPTGLAWHNNCIWSCDADSQTIYQHNMDEDLTVANEYASPSTNPTGLAQEGSRYVLEGIFYIEQAVTIDQAHGSTTLDHYAPIYLTGTLLVRGGGVATGSLKLKDFKGLSACAANRHPVLIGEKGVFRKDHIGSWYPGVTSIRGLVYSNDGWIYLREAEENERVWIKGAEFSWRVHNTNCIDLHYDPDIQNLDMEDWTNTEIEILSWQEISP